MIFIHAGILNGVAVVWAEEQKELAETQKDKHPFSVTREELLDILRTHLLDYPAGTKSASSSLCAWLPSVELMPLPSNALLGPKGSFDLKASARLPWMVDSCVLRPGDVTHLISMARNKIVLLPGVFLAPEFQYLSMLEQFAEALVARQQYLPGVIYEDGNYFAKWQPVFQKDEQLRLHELSAMLPAVVRSLTGSVREEMPGADTSLPILKEYLAASVDSFVRQALMDELVQRAIGKRRIRTTPVSTGRKAKTAEDFDSVHDCWLDALKSKTGRMYFDKAELAKFAKQIEQWHQPIVSIEAAPFRLCFRLDEPQGEDSPDDDRNSFEELIFSQRDEKWKVSYLLHSITDPSLFIPAAEVWNANPVFRSKFALNKFNAREYLFLSLGQASQLSAEISESLRSNAPKGFELDSSAAFKFITETSTSLEEAGFDVMVPPWWKRRKRIKRKVKAQSPTMKAGSKLSLDRIVEFQWQVAIGEHALTLAELNAIAELKTPLVRIRGQWVHMDAEEIRAAIDFLKRKKRDQMTVRDLVNISISGGATGEVEVEASGWIADLLEQLEQSNTLEELAPPKNFIGELRPYQKRGYSWLSFLSQWGLGACLADDMGLGKTVQTLALIQKEKANGEEKPVLLICPTSVVDNWRKEASRFTPDLSVLVHHGSKRSKGGEFQELAAQHGIVISSYALLHRDQHLKNIEWAGIVLDEAQNIKNAQTKQSKAAKDLNCRYRIALTGTPVENSVADLWSLMDFLNPGLLGTKEVFRRNLFRAIQIERDPEAREQLKKITRPFILRRLKTDKTIISDLPEKQEMKVYCSLSKEQVTLYQAVLKDLERKLDETEGLEKAGLVLSTLSRLKQVCNHPAHFLADNSGLDERSGKLDRLIEILEEILAGKEKVLIFSQFTEMGELIKQHIAQKLGKEALYLHGGVNKQKRDTMVERFQSTDGPSIFLLSLKAGGTGLNLTAANHVIHYDRWWNPAVENQASDRAFRIGQTKNVQIRKFICSGTLEEKIDEMIEAKREIAEEVVGTGEGWLTQLSNSEIKEVFALSQETLASNA